MGFIYIGISWLIGVLLKGSKFLINKTKFLVAKVHQKKRYYIPCYLLLAYVLFVVVLIKISGDKEFSNSLKDKRVVDVTQLNSIQVGEIIRPETNQEIVDAIKNSKGTISIGGGRYSMGGQVAFENSLHFDMRGFNKVLNLNLKQKQVVVQAGISWRALQAYIDKYDLAVKIMQTYANFTVGGSVSVNCHGRYIGQGPIGSSVIELKLITASGKIIVANRSENASVFKAVIGGYGGIGIISEVTLQLVGNEKVERHTTVIDAADYTDYFENKVKPDSSVIFQNGDLYPPNYDQVNDVTWKKSTKELTDTTRINEFDRSHWLEQKLITVVSWGRFGKWLRQKVLDPWIYSSEKVVWRNNEASYDVAELEPVSRKESTYVLQEYFIPLGQMNAFIPKMKSIYEKHEVNVINVSLRHAYPDKESFLSWANEEVFAFVIYYKQGTTIKDQEAVNEWTIEMTDAILSVNGKWYLPYQPQATKLQFEQAYTYSSKYFAVKDSIDPMHRFTNKLLDKYHPKTQNDIASLTQNIAGYTRDEQQSILTVPEWYLVFNPKEYANYISSGSNPSDFPYYGSINEYWKIYDKSLKLVSAAYPKNEEYITMLKVIGISMTLEYAIKIVYENTIGRVFSWFTEDTVSAEEKEVFMAHKAYADFIYQTAWYEFEFLHWVKMVWSAKGTEEYSWLRKWERMLFFTAEFTVKAGYAQLIEWGAQASYEEPVTEIFLIANTSENPEKLTKNNDDIRLVAEQGNKKIFAINRWGAFTKAMIACSNLNFENFEITEIGGNNEIVVSTLIQKEQAIIFEQAQLLYESEVVTRKDLIRKVHLLPVTKLMEYLQFLAEKQIELEHVFDY